MNHESIEKLLQELVALTALRSLQQAAHSSFSAAAANTGTIVLNTVDMIVIY